VTASECWQYRVKKQKAAQEGDGCSTLRTGVEDVRRIPFQQANTFIREYEWLGNIGSAKYCYGLLVGEHLASVACYTTPAAPNAYRSLFGAAQMRGVYQLCRGASAHWAPKWAASKVIAHSLRLIRQEFGALAVVAYADPAAGEIGTVYQAANALYLGMTDSRGPGKYIICGKEYHARAVQKAFGSARHEHLLSIDSSYVRIQRTRKHRYLFLVCKRRQSEEFRARVQHLVRPYPKRPSAMVGLDAA
jgi:hypothetical protein